MSERERSEEILTSLPVSMVIRQQISLHTTGNSMASFGTEFHATHDEVGKLIADWMECHPVYVNAFGFPPEHKIPISRATLREVMSQPGLLALTFTFTEEPIDSAINSDYDVAARGYKPLHLQIGRLTQQGLEQSSLATKTASPLWKK